MEVIGELWKLVNFFHYVSIGDKTRVIWVQLPCSPWICFLTFSLIYGCTYLPFFLLIAQKFLTLRNLCWFFPCICFCYCVSLDITHTLQNIYLHFWKIYISGRNFIKFIHYFGHYCHFNEGFQSMNIGFIEILLVLTMVCYF